MILKRIKNLILRLITRHKIIKFDISPKGEYLIKYLIDMYVNCTAMEENEIYEVRIREKEKNFYHILKKINKFTTEQEKKDFIHFHAAMALLIALLSIHKNRNKWLEYIIEEERKEYIKDLLNGVI